MTGDGFWEIMSQFLKASKDVDLDGLEGGEDLGRVEGEETIVRIHCIKTIILN